MTASNYELETQACWLGLTDQILVPDPTKPVSTPTAMCALPSLRTLLHFRNNGDGHTSAERKKQARGELVRYMQEVMIRHTKSQRIGGDVALALPDSDSATVLLEMTQDERTLYDYSKRTEGMDPNDIYRGAVNTRRFDLIMAKVRKACSHSYQEVTFGSWRGAPEAERRLRDRGPSNLTKFKALLADLAQLRREDPHMHAVVFTASVPVYLTLVDLLAEKGFAVCSFRGGDDSGKRDAAIRQFQKGLAQRETARPTIFVITLKTGAVGITLTAASRVYLMEPALDPAAEYQAAGRVHRLGQTKDVMVKRFAFKNSLDSCIIKLHEKIKDGSIQIANGFFGTDAVKILSNY